MNTKEVEIVMVNYDLLFAEAGEAVKTYSIEIPSYIIGVGVVQVVLDYIKENDLQKDGWTFANYAEKKINFK